MSLALRNQRLQSFQGLGQFPAFLSDDGFGDLDAVVEVGRVQRGERERGLRHG